MERLRNALGADQHGTPLPAPHCGPRARRASRAGSVWARSWKWQRERGPAADVVQRRGLRRGNGPAASAQRSAKTQPATDAPGRRQRARDRVQRGPALQPATRAGCSAAAPTVYGWRGVVEQLSRRPLLDELAGVQDPDAVAHLGDHAEVVADEQQRGLELAAQRRDRDRAPRPRRSRRARSSARRGSAATGSEASAIAITTRWSIPPESWCG